MPTELINGVEFDFAVEKRETDKVISQFGEECTKISKRQELRDNEVNVEAMKKSKEIAADETVIPLRKIDAAITRIKPQLNGFLEQAQRLLIFVDKQDPSMPCEDLEIAFTRWMRTPNWELPWEELNDATCLHGGSWMEVVPDANQDVLSRVEYVPRDEMMIPIDCKDVQKTERVVRMFKKLPFELESEVTTSGFDKAQLDTLLKPHKENRTEAIKIYRVLLKRAGIVWIYWHGENCTAWLKKPEPLLLGILGSDGQLAPINQYPVFFNSLSIVEPRPLLSRKGLAYGMLPLQEGETALVSAVINKATKSAQIHASTTGQPKSIANVEESKPLKPNTIVNAEVAWWSPPAPDPTLISVASFLDTEFSQNIGQVNYAAQNRKDSRKTATEIATTVDASGAMSTINTMALSITATGVYTLRWEILRAGILMGIVQGFPIPVERLMREYLLFSAGTTDFVKRNEKKNILMQLLGQLGQSPMAPLLLNLLLRYMLPEESEKLFKAQSERQVILGLNDALKQILKDPPQTLQPHELQSLANLISNADGYLAGAAGRPAQGLAEPPNDQAVSPDFRGEEDPMSAPS